MIFTQNPDAVGHQVLVQSDGLIETASNPVYVCELVTCGECVRMIFTQNPDAVGHQVLVQVNGLAYTACIFVCFREVAACP